MSKDDFNPKGTRMVVVNIVTLLTFNLAFMVICIILKNQQGYKLMALIQDETSEWSQGAIVDIKTVNASYDNIPPNICGDGYEQQPVLFLGTKNVCLFTDKSYRVGDCYRKSRGKLSYGI